MADYDVFNIEEKWFGEAEPVNYEAGVQDGVPTRTPTIVLDEDNGAVHVCKTPNPTIRNTGWTKYSTGGTPVDSDIFTVIFDMTDGGDETFYCTANCTYEELLAAKEDGKKIQAFIGMGPNVGLLAIAEEVGDVRTDFMSYPLAIDGEGSVEVMIASYEIRWDTSNEEHPIIGYSEMHPIYTGSGGDTEYLITADVMFSAAGGFSIGNVVDKDNHDASFADMVRYITGANSTTKIPIRMIAHVTNIDPDPNPNFNNYTELKFTAYDALNETITFENHTLGNNQLIFTQVTGVKESNGATSWSWDQAYLSTN